MLSFLKSLFHFHLEAATMSAHISLEEMQKAYMRVFTMLLVFTALTVFAAKGLHFPESWGAFGHILHVEISIDG